MSISSEHVRDGGVMAASFPRPVKNPLVAYVLLWFPLASETFVFREIEELGQNNMDILVYTLYGKAVKGWSNKMNNYGGRVKRFGSISFFKICGAFLRALKKKPATVRQLAVRGLFRRMRSMEALGENIWSFFSGFLLAEQCAHDKIELIHAPWANGPATAAWVASAMSGIPFAFSGRAGDIYPEDGILAEKCSDALFIRTNNAANMDWLRSFCPSRGYDKIKLVYNSCTFNFSQTLKRPEAGPVFRLLAVGRFVRTKGFPYLFTAMARLRRENVPVELTLVGDGLWRGKLLGLRQRLGLEDCIHMPGFIPNDKLTECMLNHDLLVVPSVVHSNGDRDGIPNVIMEALSLELPVVATDVCGISEVVRHGETGLLTPQRDSAALAVAIRRMYEDRCLATQTALKGRLLVKEMFDPQKNSMALKKLYLDSLEAVAHAQE